MDGMLPILLAMSAMKTKKKFGEERPKLSYEEPTEGLIKEYELIKKKESNLPATTRRRIVATVEDYYKYKSKE